VTKISGPDTAPASIGTERIPQRPSPAATPATPTDAASAVRITQQARQLAALEKAVQTLPAVNDARVASIRLAIAQANYEVAPERIAEKLLRLTQELDALNH
jgi:negative regulator of flagellin synthesis FlgM